MVFGENDGAFTCAANLVDTEQFMKLVFKQPEKIQQVLAVTKEADGGLRSASFSITAWILCRQRTHQGGSPALLSPRFCKTIVLPLEQEIIKRVNGLG